MQTLSWPPELGPILSQLKAAQVQDWIVTPMDAGPPKRRPRSSPTKIYECEVVVDDLQCRRLYAMENEPGIVYQIVLPETGRPEIVKLMPPINGVWREGYGGTLILKFQVLA